MRAFTAAAVQIAPRPGPLSPAVVRANVGNAAAWVRRCVETCGAELVVLPETVSTGFTAGVGPEELWDLAGEIPGPVTDPLSETVRDLGVHVVCGAYERGARRGVVHNSAFLLGPDGGLLGLYRKTHPFPSEHQATGGWTTPGVEATVVDTSLGRIGMMICFDGDFPELARILTVRGAEVLVRPSALLRSADIWELTCRARAYDNHVFLIGANATGADPGGRFYFGNSLIVTPVAEVVARAASHECFVAARLDPQTAMAGLTPGSSVPHGFDHLATRNLTLLNRYADDLARPAVTPFPR